MAELSVDSRFWQNFPGIGGPVPVSHDFSLKETCVCLFSVQFIQRELGLNARLRVHRTDGILLSFIPHT